MGGGHTQTITNNNPGVFGYIGVFSMGIMNMGTQRQDASKLEQERIAKLEVLKNSGYKLYWIAVGKDDFAFATRVMYFKASFIASLFPLLKSGFLKGFNK